MFKRFFKNVKGATAIEYSLIAALIAMVAISGMRYVGNMVNNKFTAVADGLQDDGGEVASLGPS